MESYIKIRSSLNKMIDRFNNDYSNYYYIKYYNAINYNDNINADKDILTFECLIRHNELEKNIIERKYPYTFKTLDKKFNDYFK